ncbi:MAG: ABC transporter substrate-binding protein [Actinobacteria bacterium]|nr:ABC transporter substrate-binding protein [Actinomycetota bacterium]
MFRGRLPILAVVLILFAGCVESEDPDIPRRRVVATPTGGQSTLVIGLVATLSGGGVFGGEDALEGADLAVQLMNRSLAEDRSPFELVTLDDQGEVARARHLVEELAASDRTVGIVYAGPPEALPELEPVLAEAGIPALLVYGDLYSPRRLTPHVFQMSPPFLWQSRRIASYLLRDRRYEAVGALVERSFTGRSAWQSLRTALGERDARARVAIQYEPDRSDLRSSLQALKARRVEAIVVHGPPEVLPALFDELREMDAIYRGTGRARTASAARSVRIARRRKGVWRPQIVAYDLVLGPRPEASRYPPGTVAAASYARGVHYLPVPSFVAFRRAFGQWWDARPLGLEVRSYDAARAIGTAALRGVQQGDDLARVLERLDATRFGGLDIAFGPDDHTGVDQVSVGLWVVPRADAWVRERDRLPPGLPWVPLARGFSIDGTRTDIESKDWRHLFVNPPPPRAPAPRVRRMRFGVTTPRSDPIH